MARIINNKRYKGLKPFRLELLEYSRPGGSGTGQFWWALCDCGQICEVQARMVRNGRVKTCGNCGNGLGIQAGKLAVDPAIPAGYREHYRGIIRQLLAVGRADRLSPSNYVGLLKNRCVGCNSPETRPELESLTHIRLLPLCKTCNHHRNGSNCEKWLEHCLRVAASVHGRAVNNCR